MRPCATLCSGQQFIEMETIVSKLRLQVLALAVALASSVWAVGAEQNEQTIELKDGGRIVVQKDGTTLHTDATGKRVAMKDGVVMEGKDGQKYVMKNKVLQKHIIEKGGGMAPR